MAVQAPLHLERIFLIHQWHLVDSAVATGASDALVHVNLVIEVDVVRQVVDADPVDGCSGRPALTNRLEELSVRPDLRMAVDAGLGGGDTGVARLLHGRVTVLALQAQTLDVVFVAKRNRLVWPLTLPRHPRGTLQ